MGDQPGSRLLEVVALMDRLRSPGGCPWDAEQTHASLMPYLLEEAYETYDALERGDLEHLREELGDLLLQIVFHARISSETGWDIDDVAGDLVDKLVRRHPHVFAGAPADDLEGSWDALKAAEKGRVSVTEGIPLGQPALTLAAKLQRRAAKLGAPAPRVRRSAPRTAPRPRSVLSSGTSSPGVARPASTRRSRSGRSREPSATGSLQPRRTCWPTTATRRRSPRRSGPTASSELCPLHDRPPRRPGQRSR